MSSVPLSLHGERDRAPGGWASLRAAEPSANLSDISNLSDQGLLRRYAVTRSELAFSEIVYRHSGWVYHTCRRSLRDGHLAEDATQAVFLLLARKVVAIRPETHLGGWLYQACRYVLADIRKHHGRYRKRQELARHLAEERAAAAEQQNNVPQVDPAISADLDDAIAALRDGDRQIILMHFYEGLAVPQIAEQLGITPEGAKKRVQRALQRVRARMTGKLATAGKKSAPAVVIVAILRGRGAEAAPADVASAVARAVTRPGSSSLLAELIIEGVRRATLRGTGRLLSMLATIVLQAVVVMTLILRMNNNTTIRKGSLAARGQVASSAEANLPAMIKPNGDGGTARASDIEILSADPSSAVEPYVSEEQPAPNVEAEGPAKVKPAPPAAGEIRAVPATAMRPLMMRTANAGPGWALPLRAEDALQPPRVRSTVRAIPMTAAISAPAPMRSNPRQLPASTNEGCENRPDRVDSSSHDRPDLARPEKPGEHPWPLMLAEPIAAGVARQDRNTFPPHFIPDGKQLFWREPDDDPFIRGGPGQYYAQVEHEARPMYAQPVDGTPPEHLAFADRTSFEPPRLKAQWYGHVPAGLDSMLSANDYSGEMRDDLLLDAVVDRPAQGVGSIIRGEQGHPESDQWVSSEPRGRWDHFGMATEDYGRGEETPLYVRGIVVPEPRSWGLISLACGALLSRRRLMR